MISHKTKLWLTIGDKRKEVTLLVTGLGKQKIILGHPWLEKENLDINWKKGTLTWREEEELKIKAIDEERSPVKDEPPAISRIEEVEDDQEWMNHTQNPLEEEESVSNQNKNNEPPDKNTKSAITPKKKKTTRTSSILFEQNYQNMAKWMTLW